MDVKENSFDYPQWYEAEKNVEKTIKKLTRLDEIEFYLNNADEFIRRLAILRIHELKLKNSIEKLKSLVDNNYESNINKKLAAWTIKSICQKYKMQLYVDNPILNKFSGKEILDEITGISFIDPFCENDIDISQTLINTEIELENIDLLRTQEISFDTSFSYNEWFKFMMKEFSSNILKNILYLPVNLVKAIAMVFAFIFISPVKFLFKGISSIFSRPSCSTSYTDIIKDETPLTSNDYLKNIDNEPEFDDAFIKKSKNYIDSIHVSEPLHDDPQNNIDNNESILEEEIIKSINASIASQEKPESITSDYFTKKYDSTETKQTANNGLPLIGLDEAYNKPKDPVDNLRSKKLKVNYKDLYENKKSIFSSLKNVFINILYVLFMPWRFFKKHKIAILASIVVLYCFIVFFPTGRQLSIKLFNIDSKNVNDKIFNSVKDELLVVKDEFMEILGMNERKKIEEIIARNEEKNNEKMDVASDKEKNIKYRVISKTGLNVRKEASISSQRITTIQPGEVVTYLAQSKKDSSGAIWLYINTSSEIMGWVHSSLVEEIGGG